MQANYVGSLVRTSLRKRNNMMALYSGRLIFNIDKYIFTPMRYKFTIYRKPIHI